MDPVEGTLQRIADALERQVATSERTALALERQAVASERLADAQERIALVTEASNPSRSRAPRNRRNDADAPVDDASTNKPPQISDIARQDARRRMRQRNHPSRNEL